MATGPSRVLRKQIAEATLKILENGSYILDGRTHQLPSATLRTQFYNSAKLTPWNSVSPEVTFPKTEISILEIPTIQTAQLLSSRPQLDAAPAAGGAARTESNVGVLNFASAKNPGGGFLGGAQAQEESIARSSTLYQSLTCAPASEYYSSHRKDLDGGYYSHAMIFSPHITVFRDDSGALIEPFQISVVTSPAVNAGVVRSHARKHTETGNLEETEKKIEVVMKERMARILFLFESRGVSRLVLGSFGTGVFQNSVPMVARLWAELLGKPESRFASSFETVIFGIIGHQTYEEFKEVFNQTCGNTHS